MPRLLKRLPVLAIVVALFPATGKAATYAESKNDKNPNAARLADLHF